MDACGVCSVIWPAAVKATIRTRYWRARLTSLEAKAIPIRRPIWGAGGVLDLDPGAMKPLGRKNQSAIGKVHAGWGFDAGAPLSSLPISGLQAPQLVPAFSRRPIASTFPAPLRISDAI